MNHLSTQELALISGGSSESGNSNSVTCAGLQTQANIFGKNWSNEEWEKWCDEMLAAGCPYAIVTPSQPNPTTPDN